MTASRARCSSAYSPPSRLPTTSARVGGGEGGRSTAPVTGRRRHTRADQRRRQKQLASHRDPPSLGSARDGRPRARGGSTPAARPRFRRVRGIFVAPFGELSEPRRSPAWPPAPRTGGWDGFFVWDHVAYEPPVREHRGPLGHAVRRGHDHDVAGHRAAGDAAAAPADAPTRARDRHPGTASARAGWCSAWGPAATTTRASSPGLPRRGAVDPRARGSCSTPAWSGWCGRLGRGVRAAAVARADSRCGWPRRGWRRGPMRRAARWDGWFPI